MIKSKQIQVIFGKSAPRIYYKQKKYKAHIIINLQKYDVPKDAFSKTQNQCMPQCTFFTTKKRQKLVDMVINRGIPIAKAARKLTIKISAAKQIMKVFRLTGTFSMKRSEKITQRTVGWIADSIQRIEQSPMDYQEQQPEVYQNLRNDGFPSQIVGPESICPFVFWLTFNGFEFYPYFWQ